MAATNIDKLHLKVGTKAQYEANKASLDSSTLSFTPLASEFTSNTAAGKSQFAVSGVIINTLSGATGSAKQPIHITGGAFVASDTTVAVQNSTDNLYRNVYFGSDTQANLISNGETKLSTSATFAFNPSLKKFQLTSSDASATTLTFGLEVVETW